MVFQSVLLAAVLAAGIPNPVPLRNDVSHTVVRVTCRSSADALGTWARYKIVDDEAVDEPAVRDLRPSDPRGYDDGHVLYCVGAHHQPGTIAGAPKSLLLAAGTHVHVFAAITISGPTHAKKRNTWVISTPLGQPVQRSSQGLAILLNEHELIVAPNTFKIVSDMPEARYDTQFYIPTASDLAGCHVISLGDTDTDPLHTDRTVPQTCTFSLVTKGGRKTHG